MLQKVFTHIGLFFLRLLALLPMPVLYFLADGVYLLLYHVIGYRRKVARENLQNVFPDKELAEIVAIEKKFYRYLVSLMVEIVKMDSISEKEVQKRFTFKDLHLMEAYWQKNEGTLICTAHYGNWEWAGLSLGLTGSAQNYIIYKPLNNDTFEDWFHKVRTKYGNKAIAMRQTLRAIQASKGEASVFCFANDQAPSKDESHYWTTFLNQESSVQLGIEKIAKKTNRPVFYLRTRVIKRGYYEMECVPICMEPANTAEYEITELHIRFLEKMIIEDPAYWLWSHRRWKYKRG